MQVDGSEFSETPQALGTTGPASDSSIATIVRKFCFKTQASLSLMHTLPRRSLLQLKLSNSSSPLLLLPSLAGYLSHLVHSLNP